MRAPLEAPTQMKTFALALGGGGARGLAHIPVIEALDEIGVKAVAIAGSSIGALVGAAYAAGMSGKDLRRYVIGLAHNPGETRRHLIAARAGKLADIFSGGWSQATQLDAEKFCAAFLPDAVPTDFSDLVIPLTVMATDLHARREAPLSSGTLRPALAASMAIPGCFDRSASMAAFSSMAALPIRCRSISSPGAPMSSSPSMCSACRRRIEATCRAHGRASMPRC